MPPKKAVVEEKLTTIDVPGRLGAFLAVPGRAERLAGDASAVVTALTQLLRDEDLEPAVAALAGLVILDQVLHGSQLLGMGLVVLASAIVIGLGARKDPAESTGS